MAGLVSGFEVAVVGAGVAGLTLARELLARGARVTVLDGGAPPASATPVGALMPLPRAAPDDPLAALQTDGLTAMPGLAAALAAETRIDPGYRVVGRVTPIADPKTTAEAIARFGAIAAAQQAAGHRPTETAPPLCALGAGQLHTAIPHGFLAPDAAAHGGMVDTVTARIDAAMLLRALRAAVSNHPNGTILDAWPVGHLAAAQAAGGRAAAIGPRGRLPADAVVVASGHSAAAFASAMGMDAGRPVKGQAAMLKARLPDGAPVVQAPGLFIVPHSPGPDGAPRVGVGSTREAGRTDLATNAQLDEVIDRAAEFVPALKRAPVLSRWAGIRPRPPARLPQAGPIPARPGLWMLTGGHGIGIALAPALAKRVAEALIGERPLPALPTRRVRHTKA
ncbi:MAG: FAD-dependent oxidoreductase [Pseudomonadota bacterium]